MILIGKLDMILWKPEGGKHKITEGFPTAKMCKTKWDWGVEGEWAKC